MTNRDTENEDESWGIFESLKTWRAWHMLFLLFLGSFYPLFIASAYKPIAQDVLEDSVLTVAGAIGGICNGFSRLFWAILMDKYGFKPVYGSLQILQLAVAASIYQMRSNPILYPIWVGLSYFCEGGHFPLFATLGVQILGLKNGGSIIAIILIAVPFSSTLSWYFV